MDAQGLSEGSLRNSHRETHAVRRKPAPAKLQQRASALVESCSQDLVLRQRLDPVRMEPVLKKGTFYVMTNEGRGEPGFLVFLPDQPAVYIQYRKGRPPMASTLRLRVSSALSEGGGTILIATLDDVMHMIRFEDVWMWRGQVLTGQGGAPYSARRERLKEFVERHWIPDARLLGGIFASVAQPMSLEAFTGKGDWVGVNSVEFIPEQAGRRRMVHWLEEQQKRAEGHAGLKKERVVAPAPAAAVAAAAPATVPAAAPTPPVAQRRARAVPVEKMPDVYDLFGEDGLPISRASVQQFALSKAIKERVATKQEAWVTARWRAEFGGYEISALD